MDTTDPLPHLLTIDQLAEHLGVTVRHVRRLIAERRIPYVKWRRFIRFDANEIANWLDSARHPECNRHTGRREADGPSGSADGGAGGRGVVEVQL